MNKRILLIDDDPDEITIFSAAVAAAGFSYECFAAGSAMQALELLQATVPDYIFVDINMPRINGLMCISMLRKLPQLDAVPIIVYSTGAEITCAAALAAGATGCINKVDGIERQAISIGKVLSQPA